MRTRPASGSSTVRAVWWRSLVDGGVLSLVLVVLATWAGTALWRTWHDQAMASRLQGSVRPGDIRMISSVTCFYCTQARHWMTEHRIPFEECFIERDPQCAAAYQNTGARGTPTLQVRGETHIGFDTARLAKALAPS